MRTEVGPRGACGGARRDFMCCERAARGASAGTAVPSTAGCRRTRWTAGARPGTRPGATTRVTGGFFSVDRCASTAVRRAAAADPPARHRPARARVAGADAAPVEAEIAPARSRGARAAAAGDVLFIQPCACTPTTAGRPPAGCAGLPSHGRPRAGPAARALAERGAQSLARDSALARFSRALPELSASRRWRTSRAGGSPAPPPAAWRGKPLARVAEQAGYRSDAVFSKAFAASPPVAARMRKAAQPAVV